MGRVHVDVAIPALALRRAQAAEALGISVEVFDKHVRSEVPAVRVGGVVTYPVAGLQRWLEKNAARVLDQKKAA
jgi:hypothetical protein